MPDANPASGFLARHEFLIRRLHSLSGLIPVGAYLVVHLLTNASVLGGTAAFQSNVDRIHSLGALLPVVEWVFIFIPILFHAILGVVFIAGGVPNTSNYAYRENIRYTLQRATGIIAFFYIGYHVWQMHHYFGGMGGGKFDAQAAASSVAVVLAPLPVKIIYAVGMLACVYHLANGLWTMGITWGLWTSPAAQRRADWIALGFGIALSIVGVGSLFGFGRVNVTEAQVIEKRMEKARELSSGQIDPTQLSDADAGQTE